ncbi:hypothetical protein Nmel_002322 [Mimus melanotis]
MKIPHRSCEQKQGTPFCEQPEGISLLMQPCWKEAGIPALCENLLFPAGSTGPFPWMQTLVVREPLPDRGGTLRCKFLHSPVEDVQYCGETALPGLGRDSTR